MELDLFHPALRDKGYWHLSSRVSSFNFFFPADERINWCGDIRLYCTAALYQHVLDSVPGAVTVGEGEERRIDPVWQGLDDYRLKVEAWLGRKRFD